MYLSYSLSKCHVCFHILVIQLLIRSVLSLNLTNAYLQHKCLVNQGEYKPGSAYEENLNYLINHLSTYHFRDGFRQTSHGEAPDSVTIIFQCRGDSYGSKCRSCYTTAVAGLRRKCSKNKGGIIWYDQCFLDVSTINSGWKTDYEDTFLMHNPNNMSGDTESLNKKTRDFLYELALKADKPKADGSGLLYYAAGEKKLGKRKLYAMVQCALNIFHCKVCLQWCIKELSKCCDGKQGARVLGTSCNVRYELYPFIRT